MVTCEYLIILIIIIFYMKNYSNFIGLEQWYFGLIWKTYMRKLPTFFG